ncbi:MAG: BREX system ATP-binding domain-containing protein [Actinomycetes bacterium]
MAIGMRPPDWVSFMEANYLQDFIADGGASIKFAVPLGDTDRDEMIGSLVEAAARHRFMPVQVDASITRFHMIDQVFFAIAKQIPWQGLARNYVIAQARHEGYRLTEDPGDSLLQSISELNDTDGEMLLNELRGRLSRTVYRDPSLAKDFRVAMMQFCLAELLGGEEGAAKRAAVLEWITGENRLISAVKPYGIFSRINRNNARFLLESLFAWVRSNGWNGTVVILDTASLTLPRRPETGLFYTKLTLLDSYEVLRQFIDSTDRLAAVLMVVLPSSEFLDSESGGRGMGAYEALKFRVYDEVRDRRLVNPMASLMRLDPQFEEVTFA